MSGTDEEEEEPKAPHRGFLARLGDIVPRAPLAALALAVGFLALAMLWPHLERLPFPPFETTGRVFVESPEIYTRERLVNDRYLQDYWLKQQLLALDSAKDLVSARRKEALDIWLQTRPADKADPPPDLLPLPFQTEFQLRSGMRDRIRQMILENQLDDRHDLTGNSVYGLKFDTSVLPGVNTRRSAYVRVKVRTPPLPKREDLPRILRYRWDEINTDPTNEFHGLPTHFFRWIEDISWRLDSYLDAATPATCVTGPDDPFISAQKSLPAIGEGFARILSVESSLIGVRLQERPAAHYTTGGTVAAKLDLPGPWDRFFHIDIYANPDCPDRPRVRIEQNFSHIILVEDAAWSSLLAAQYSGTETEKAAASARVREVYRSFFASDVVAWTENGQERRLHIFVRRNRAPTDDPLSNFPTEEEWRDIAPGIRITSAMTRILLDSPVRQNVCLTATTPGDSAPCPVPGLSFSLGSGFYNFLELISGLDSYVYAVFPKEDVEGILEQSGQRATLAAPADASGPGLLLEGSESRAHAVPLQVSFTEAGPEGSTVTFGWVIASDGPMEPVQKSQLVLVSLPAYLRALTLEVETGWMTHDGRFRPDGPGRIVPVALPPEYEAFDTLMTGGARHGPAILNNLMQKNLRLRACEKAQILIPGARLWRSTTVTLGGQVAEQIAVMPNMRGIVATFNMVEIPTVELSTLSPSDSTPVARVPLQVWTSEGSDRLNRDVIVTVPAGGSCPKPGRGRIRER